MATIMEMVWATGYATGILLLMQFILPAIVKFFYKKPKDEVRLYEKKWKRDTVYLYQMPGTSNLPSISPFCLKVESFLRLHKINYERRYFLVGRGINGKLPFVELNGEHHTDSTIILKRLAFHFKLQEYATPEDALFGHCISRMADCHTYNIFLHYKVTHNAANLYKGMAGGLVPEIAIDMTAPFITPFVSGWIHRRLNDVFGKFTDEEYREMTRKDLTVLQDILGEKKFLLGDAMNSADCTVFGHLAAMLYLDQNSHPVFLLKSHQFVPLRQYIERVRDQLFGGKFHM